MVQGVVFALHYFQQICNRSLRLFVHPCATTITLPLLVKIRFSLLLLSAFFFTLLSISIVPFPVGITSDGLMFYLSICARIMVFPCVSTVFLLLWSPYAIGPLSVCSVRALWSNGWMDLDETWHAGRLRPWPHCVRWRPSPRG